MGQIPVVVKQILTCSHMKRAITAHEITVTVLYKLYFEALRKEQPSLFAASCASVYVLLRDLKQAFKSGNEEEVKAKTAAVSSFTRKVNLLRAMKQFQESRKKNKMSQTCFIYMRMVERLQSFVYASRNRDWLLHLKSSKQLLQDYCSMDRTKYQRLTPVYIASMCALEETDPQIWESFINVEFCVKKS